MSKVREYSILGIMGVWYHQVYSLSWPSVFWFCVLPCPLAYLSTNKQQLPGECLFSMKCYFFIDYCSGSHAKMIMDLPTGVKYRT